MAAFWGIDAGNQRREGCCDGRLRRLAGQGLGECDLIHPAQAGVEQDPQAWWEACDAAVRQAAAKRPGRKSPVSDFPARCRA